jgi:guanylate kinase
MKSNFLETKGFSNLKSNLLENHHEHEESQEQRLKERSKVTFKQGTRQDYVIQKQKHKNTK